MEHHNAWIKAGDPDAQVIDSRSYEAVRTPHALDVQYADGELEYYNTDQDPWKLRNIPGQAPGSIRAQLAAFRGCAGTARFQAAAGA